MPAFRGRSETRQTPPGARPNRRAQPRLAGGRGALPSPRVGCMSRRATGGLRWMTVAVAQAAAQNSAYRPPRWRLTRPSTMAFARPGVSARQGPRASPRRPGTWWGWGTHCMQRSPVSSRQGGGEPEGQGRGTPRGPADDPAWPAADGGSGECGERPSWWRVACWFPAPAAACRARSRLKAPCGTSLRATQRHVRLPERTAVSATDGGAYHPGFDHCKPREVLDSPRPSDIRQRRLEH